MKKHLEFHGIPSFEKISAIDYKDFVSLDENNQGYIDYEKVKKGNLLEKIKTKRDYYIIETLPELFPYDYKKIRMTLPEVCVTQSHRKAWKEAMNYDYSLILEDDVTFTSKIPPLLNYIENDFNINFDIFLLGWAIQDETNTSDVNILSPYIIRKINRALFLHAYVITKDMAKKLYESTIIGSVDSYLSDLYQNINCYGVYASSQTEGHLPDNIHFADIEKHRLVIEDIFEIKD